MLKVISLKTLQILKKSIYLLLGMVDELDFC